MGKMNWFVTGVMVGLSAGAIDQELKKDAAERTWKGTIAGVPYNFNVPEWRAIAAEYWNPDSSKIVSPHAIGMGWGINFAAVVQRAQALANQEQLRRITSPDRS